MSDQTPMVAPGCTIGILGGGQLGRMMAIAAKQMGYRIHIFSETDDSPGGQVADLEVVGSLDDLPLIESFARAVDVVTIETENIPTATLNTAAKIVPSYPGHRTLETCQDRGKEKQFLLESQIPTCGFRIVRSVDELKEACQDLSPAVLKTTSGGYDGKGQARIASIEDAEDAWQSLGTTEAILEEWIEYDFEFSVVAARAVDGQNTAYASIRNNHVNGILDVSICPSGVSEDACKAATEIVFAIMDRLESVGVLTVEFFYRGGEVLVNEIAPRPHNSGHLTIEGHVTSQFEQHVRAICGLAFGSTELLKPIAMANLLGDCWLSGQPRWDSALASPNTKLHLYGKQTPKPGRKMGHLTATAESAELASQNVVAMRELLPAEPDQAEGKEIGALR
jgi:5-(carboxyamino)imidazole ribonucleotide synthase